MLLRNFDSATKYFDYEAKTELTKTSDTKINGWYKIINGLLSALLVTDNKLYFFYGDQKIMIMEFHRVQLKRNSNTENEFNLVDGNDSLVKFSYLLPETKFNISPFEYIDEEDFNWGEFIAKVINDKEHQTNFVKNLMQNSR